MVERVCNVRFGWLGARVLLFALICGVVCGGGVGCRKEKESSSAEPAAQAVAPAANSAAAAGKYKLVSNDKTYEVTYTPTPDPIPMNELFELRVWVRPVSGAPKAGMKYGLLADAAMPEHSHGMNTQAKVAANADGSFTVSGMNFHMPGRWELYLDVVSDGVTERAQTEVRLE